MYAPPSGRQARPASVVVGHRRVALEVRHARKNHVPRRLERRCLSRCRCSIRCELDFPSPRHVAARSRFGPCIFCRITCRVFALVFHSHVSARLVLYRLCAGKIFLWNVTTGEQLRAWDAHFKKVTALRFTDDDSFLVSGGEDAVINVWLLAQVGAIFFLLIVIPILSFPF